MYPVHKETRTGISNSTIVAMRITADSNLLGFAKRCDISFSFLDTFDALATVLRQQDTELMATIAVFDFTFGLDEFHHAAFLVLISSRRFADTAMARYPPVRVATRTTTVSPKTAMT